MEVKVIEPIFKNSMVKKKVCAYARVSTDSLEQEDSLDNQTSYYQTYIDSNPEWEFAGIYSDQGISGFKEKRPGFQQMIADARSGKIDLIVVKSVSRFARNTETVLKFSRELRSIGVGIFFELQNINTLSGEGELMLTILAAFAQAESESASGNVRTAIKQRFERGIAVFPLDRIYGFARNENDEFYIDAQKAEVVKLIFDLAEQGVWVSKIKEYLNKNGIPSPEGALWCDTTINYILRQEAYMGDRVLQKTYTDSNRKLHTNNGEMDQWYLTDSHEGIVTKEQWHSVQEKLDKRMLAYKKKAPKEKVKHSCHSTYPLSGKLFCPYCGCVLYHKWDNDQSFEYWICSTHLKVSKKRCPGVYIPARFIKSWEGIEEPVVAIKYEDEFGMTQYEAFPKEEYEAEHEYPYEYHKPVKEKKIKPEKPKKVGRKHHEKPEGNRYTRKVYPLSGKLYCPYCGQKLTHLWDGPVPYWVCSTNRNWHRKKLDKKCKGLYFPEEVADCWGEITEPVVVVPYKDEIGNKYYTAYPKDEYEQSEECEYRKDA